MGSESLLNNVPSQYLPTLEELPGDLRLIADVIGVEPAIRLAGVFGGTGLYVPRLDKFIRRVRDKNIREEFDRRTSTGESATKVVNDIARREKMPCARQVWNVLNGADERQMGLFES